MGPGVELYRGENGTWAKRIPSLSWTRNLEVARAFARQCAQFHRSGGVVLHAYVPTSYVIADLTAHGHDGEDEFIVDARGLKFEIVERLVPQLAI
jgi:microcystin degradation protein MlrC